MFAHTCVINLKMKFSLLFLLPALFFVSVVLAQEPRGMIVLTSKSVPLITVKSPSQIPCFNPFLSGICILKCFISTFIKKSLSINKI